MSKAVEPPSDPLSLRAAFLPPGRPTVAEIIGRPAFPQSARAALPPLAKCGVAGVARGCERDDFVS
jgi:hypothetical protein